MKDFQVYFVLGGMLLLIGVFLLFPTSPISGNENVTLPPFYYSYLALSVSKGGRILGHFIEASGHPVNLYFFDNSQYTAFQTQSSTQGLFSSMGASGSYSASIASPGTYYLAFTHTANFTMATQQVKFSYTIDGYNSLFLGAGLAVLGAGVALLVSGYYSKGKYRAKASSTIASDVVVFDQAQPPVPSQAEA